MPRIFFHCGFYPCEKEDRGRELVDLVERFELAGSCGRLVLDPSDYRMLQTAVPEVPTEEMREALRCRVQELLDFPAHEAEK